MNNPCFVNPFVAAVRPAFMGSSVTSRHPHVAVQTGRRLPRAALDLVPGIPPGEDARDNAPMRYFVPRPAETYEKRSFSTTLPRTWEGEIETVGPTDIGPLTKEDIEEKRIVKVDPAATGAFVEYAQMVKDERLQALEDQKARSQLSMTGRATCGEEEGKAFVSNYRPILVDGVKSVEYWGTPNGAVPRLFGGPGA